MPIRPENKHGYPKDWRAIRARILSRAGNRCEGCAVPNGATVERNGKLVLIVLTIAHLDHTPGSRNGRERNREQHSGGRTAVNEGVSAMSVLLLRLEKTQTGPVPASGIHAELLAEISRGASALIKLVELERSGVYDGLGQDFWTGFDSVLSKAQQLVELAKQRAAELKDVAIR